MLKVINLKMCPWKVPEKSLNFTAEKVYKPCLWIVFFYFHLLQIDYPQFEKNFYIEHEEISKLTAHEVQELRKKLAVKVTFQPSIKVTACTFWFD